MRRVLRRIILLSTFIFSFVLISYGNENDTIKAETHAAAKKFAPGEFILDHILDKHEWHIITINGEHVSIPLPVILYSEKSGLHFFMSYHFKHGHEYQNFKLVNEGPNKGNFIEILADGTEYHPWDFSITKVVASLFLSVILVLLIFISIGRKYKKNPNKAPSGLQSAVEPMILFVRDDIAKSSIGEEKYEKYMPYLLTIFFFIWINNMLGLIPIFPGGVNVTGNIAITLVMAVFTFIIVTINGNKHYWKEIYNAPGVPWWLKYPPLPLMPIIEIMGIFIRPFVLMIRLFANITAGHLVALAFVSLIFIFAEMNPFLGYGMSVLSAIFSVFMGLLEILVALIQAYVFTFLSALYIGMATAEHHE